MRNRHPRTNAELGKAIREEIGKMSQTEVYDALYHLELNLRQSIRLKEEFIDSGGNVPIPEKVDILATYADRLVGYIVSLRN